MEPRGFGNMRKQFSRVLFDENDAIGKHVGIHYASQLEDEIIIRVEPTKYGVDLVATGKKHHYIECEVKYNWKGGPFPYETIQVLGRKEKYFKQGAGLILVSANMQDFLYLSAKQILAAPKVKVRNKYVYEGEEFFQVPAKKAKYFELQHTATNHASCNSCESLVLFKSKAKIRCLYCGEEYGSSREVEEIVFVPIAKTPTKRNGR